MDYCIVGEPTSVDALGDTLKNGRRGSLSGRLTVRGIQGHVAYPHLARNPVHQLAPALAELAKTQWDKGNESFPPTTLAGVEHPRRHRGRQRHSRQRGGRFQLPLLDRKHGCVADAARRSDPEEARPGLLALLGAGRPALPQREGQARARPWPRSASGIPGINAELSTTGGTSDARFIIEISPEVLELGPVNASIHKLNEHIEVAALDQLAGIYLDTLRALLLFLESFRAAARHRAQVRACRTPLRARHPQRPGRSRLADFLGSWVPS